MQHKHGAYYYQTSTTPRRWIRLHTDLARARVLWAEIENQGIEVGVSVPIAIDRWLASAAAQDRAASTRRVYENVAKQLRQVFADFQLAEVEPHHIAQWLDNHHSKAMANMGKALLNNVFNAAVRQGAISSNPARDIRDLPTKARDRYITDAEYLAIRQHADPLLRVAMDISYLTGARISDVCKIKLADITEEGLFIEQKKTGKRQRFTMTSALREALDAARALPRPVRGLTLLCTRSGQSYDPKSFRNYWPDACRAASVENAHFHDIRAKAATDAKKLGMDYQKLLGHTNKAMSDRYIRLREIDEISPLPKRVGGKN